MLSYTLTRAAGLRPAAPSLLLLHGFSGSADEWAELTPHLAPLRRVIAVDLLGHGRSPAPADAAAYTMGRCVADLLGVMDGLKIGRFDVLGYSMGGRAALHLAAAAPGRVRSLILESASPGLADPAEAAARAAADDALAGRIEAEGVGWFADHWGGIPLFASQAALPGEARAALRERRLRNSAAGLAGSLRGMGTGRQGSLWHRLGELAMPALLITGELDGKFAAINKEMAALMPGAHHTAVPGAGHAIHLERPRDFADLVVGFLRQ